MPQLNIDLPVSFFVREDKVLTVETETKRLWAVELDLLAELTRVCRKHDIRFFAISGTLIGAARHKGFIPWDDDIDVVMLRSEYRKLERVAAEEFRYPYFFQTNTTDPGFARGHAQLRRSDTTAILKCEMQDGKPLYQFNQGVFLDVFPLDALPDDSDARARFLNEVRKSHQRVQLARMRRLGTSGMRDALGAARQWFAEKFLHMDLLSVACNRLERIAQTYNARPCRQCAPIAFSPEVHRHELFDLTDFSQSIDLPFETMTVPCPADYEKVLTRAFGDWHKHVIDSNSHGGVFIDLDRPYTEYLKK